MLPTKRAYLPVWGSLHTEGRSYWTPWLQDKKGSTAHKASSGCGLALNPQRTGSLMMKR